MGLVTRMRERRALEVSDLRRAIVERDTSLALMQESIAELELALEDEGWQRLGAEGQREFSRHGLKRIIHLARIMYLKNPLVRRGVNVQTYYVWGQGVEITARNTDVNAVVQRFLDDLGNQRSLTSHKARSQREIDLQTDGNLFFALFADPTTGRVRVRVVAVDDILDIVTNPEDRDEPWYYLREWEQISYENGAEHREQKKAYYADWRYNPKGGVPASFNGKPVNADARLYHVKVGGTSGMRFGVPDVYAALDWARAYKSFLEDWASLTRSLTRWAWKVTSKKRRPRDVAERIGTSITRDAGETNPAPTTGAAFVTNEEIDLTPIPKTGATLSSEDGRQLRTMVAAALDIPDTILAGDPDMGNLATAKTLDRPTELAMRDRQTLWTGVFRDILAYVVEASVEASSGSLKGKVIDDDGIRRVDLGVEEEPGPDGEPVPIDPSFDVSFPPILERDVAAWVGAIVTAAGLGLLPDKEIARLLLVALGVEEIDELLTDAFPEDDEQADDEEIPEEGQEPEVAEAARELVAAARALREAVEAA